MSRKNLRNNEYWKVRALRVSDAGEKSAFTMLRDLRHTYQDAAAQIRKEIEAFYGKYSLETGISLTDIKKRLNPDEFKSAMEEIKRYNREVRELGGFSPEYREYLRELSARATLSRLEELQLNMERISETLYRDVEGRFKHGMTDVYTESFYKTNFDIQQGLGIAMPFTMPNTRIVNQAVGQKWLGDNYSGRLWNHKDQLINSLNTTFLRGVALGWNPRKMGRAMANDFMTKYDKSTVGNAVRLARTEFINIANQATIDAYREYGIVKQYQYLATLDERTCPICGPLDGEVFPVDKALTGINYAPMHPNCRCTSISYFPEEEIDKTLEKAERIARDPVTGKSYYVPEDMNYKEWRGSLTNNQEQHFIANQKMAAQTASDKEQFADYKKYISEQKKAHGADLVGDLFDGFPTKFADFQNMKYLGTEKWETFKNNRQELGRVEKSSEPLYNNIGGNILNKFEGDIKGTSLENWIDADGKIKADRLALYNTIQDEVFKNAAQTNNPEFYMLGGGSGAGKGTVQKGETILPKKAVTIDSDAIKTKLPEYSAMVKAGNASAARFVHEESSMVAKQIMENSIISGRYNTILDGTGTSPKAKIEQALKYGQKTNAVYVTIDVNEAIKRAEERAIRTGRKVPINDILNTHKGATKAFDFYKDKFNNVQLWDNTSTPKLIGETRNGKFTIINQKLYNNFLERGK